MQASQSIRLDRITRPPAMLRARQSTKEPADLAALFPPQQSSPTPSAAVPFVPKQVDAVAPHVVLGSFQ